MRSSILTFTLLAISAVAAPLVDLEARQRPSPPGSPNCHYGPLGGDLICQAIRREDSPVDLEARQGRPLDPPGCHYAPLGGSTLICQANRREESPEDVASLPPSEVEIAPRACHTPPLGGPVLCVAM
ncbi:hypothetical protein BDV98DRAFT_608676 [Pterulicium gracile]|uniref:Uncharacterized protein n=1 Tax=Pterulicium gracile TaxID=1884261 RepID=A0A5C3Q3T6_9AGAR|nr:hypothetical protein BDV98DRAFT_608676 [Pterula gracilis]